MEAGRRAEEIQVEVIGGPLTRKALLLLAGDVLPDDEDAFILPHGH
jgi:hypothetical protein